MTRGAGRKAACVKPKQEKQAEQMRRIISCALSMEAGKRGEGEGERERVRENGKNQPPIPVMSQVASVQSLSLVNGKRDSSLLSHLLSTAYSSSSSSSSSSSWVTRDR